MVKIAIRNYIIYFVILLLTALSSCQKDSDVKAVISEQSVSTESAVSPSANFLAAKGTLSITVEDSTYVFDAAKDSVAFINIKSDSAHYFGITAINKAHTMSFGVSSKGLAGSAINNVIAGGQFLLKNTDKSISQYSITNYAAEKEIGRINLVSYNIDNVLAKGSFFTFLAKDNNPDAPLYRVTGLFSLQLK